MRMTRMDIPEDVIHALNEAGDQISNSMFTQNLALKAIDNAKLHLARWIERVDVALSLQNEIKLPQDERDALQARINALD